MTRCNKEIYGPDLSDHEEEGRQIAEVAMRCMKGSGATGTEDKSDGPDTSKSEIDKLR
jgi:hypothetical protein